MWTFVIEMAGVLVAGIFTVVGAIVASSIKKSLYDAHPEAKRIDK